MPPLVVVVLFSGPMLADLMDAQPANVLVRLAKYSAHTPPWYMGASVKDEG